MTENRSGWTTLRGCSVPPSADGRDIVNQPMKFKAVKSGSNTFPGSSPPEEPVPPQEEPKSDLLAKEAPEPEPEVVQNNLPLEASEPLEERPRYTTSRKLKVTWQGCQFAVTFDDVWVQTENPDLNTIRWLTLVHDSAAKPEGPVWSPPVATNDEVVTLIINYEGVDYTCSYFGLTLFIPTCNLQITTFLVIDYEGHALIKEIL